MHSEKSCYQYTTLWFNHEVFTDHNFGNSYLDNTKNVRQDLVFSLS
jgi:hypothetical protein